VSTLLGKLKTQWQSVPLSQKTDSIDGNRFNPSFNPPLVACNTRKQATRAPSRNKNAFQPKNSSSAVKANVPLWSVTAGIGADPDCPILTSHAIVDSGSSSILLNNTCLSNSTNINKLNIVTNDSISLQSAFADSSTEIKGYFYGYLILYDSHNKPYPIYSKIFIAEGLSWPIFIGCNLLQDSRFKAILPTGLVLADHTNPKIERHIPFLKPNEHIHSNFLCNKESFVLRADSDSLITVYPQTSMKAGRVAVFNTNQRDNKMKVFQGTYEYEPQKPLSISVHNHSHEDIHVLANTQIAECKQIAPNSTPDIAALFQFDFKSKVITASLTSDSVKSNLLRFYPSEPDQQAAYTARSQKIMSDMNAYGYSQFSPTEAFDSQQERRSFDLPPPPLLPSLQSNRKHKRSTAAEIFALLPKDHLSEHQKNLLEQLIKKYYKVFAKDITELGKTHLVEMSADIRKGIDLSKFALKVQDTPHQYREQLETMLEQMVQADLITPAEGVVRLITPIRLIPKRDPKKMRLINDVRITNAVVMRSPDVGNETITSSLAQLRDAVVVSSLDLTSSFWQIGIDSYLSSLLAFYGPGRKLYRNLRAPMGYINSSTALQATISRMKDIPVYSDEISSLFPDHQYQAKPKLTPKQAKQALEPIQTQIVGRISEHITSTTQRAPVFHTKLSYQQLLQTTPITFRKDTIFKAYADDLNLFSKASFPCCKWTNGMTPLPSTTESCPPGPPCHQGPGSQTPTSNPPENHLVGQEYITATSQAISDSLFKHHLAELELLLLKMQKGNLQLSPQKTFICKTSLSLLGFQWSLNKLSIDEKRLDGFKQLKTPTSKSECRSLIGAYSFFRAFIPGFAKLAKPISDLAHSKLPFQWLPQHQAAKDNLYKTICQNSKLELFDPSLPVHLHTDASTAAAGGFLSQASDTGSLVLFNYSRLFTPAERNASPFRREILSCLYGLQSYQFILKAAKEVILHIDAKAMCWLKWAKSADPYVYRLSADLSEFKIDKIVCVPTILHSGADHLSRMNKNADKIEAMLGNEHNMTLHEAECLAHRLHFEKLQEITGKDLQDLMHGPSPPSFFLSKLQKKSSSRHQASDPKPPVLPALGKPRAIRPPILADRSVIKKDGPFRQPKFRKRERMQILRKLRETQQLTRKYQQQIFDLDSGRKIQSNVTSFPHVQCNMAKKKVHNEDTSLPRRESIRLKAKRFKAKREKSIPPSLTSSPSLPQIIDEQEEKTEEKHASHSSPLSNLTPSITRKLPPLIFEQFSESQSEQSTSHADLPILQKTNNHLSSPKTEIGHNILADLKQSQSFHDLTNDTPQVKPPESHKASTQTPVKNGQLHQRHLSMTHPMTHQDAEEISTSDFYVQAKLFKDGQISLQHFIHAQQQDPFCSKILSKATLPKGYFFKQGILCTLDRHDTTNFLIVLPHSLVQPLLNLYHFSLTHNHQNKDAMFRSISKKYFTPQLKQFIKLFCEQCSLCAMYSSKRLPDTEHGSEHVLGPRLKWICDLFHIALPFHDKQKDNFNFVLCCVDSFSRYSILIPLQNKSEQELYSAFLTLFSTQGIPLLIKTDGESGIAAQGLTDKLQSLGITHERGSPGHSRGQSTVENKIGKIKEIIRKLHRSNPEFTTQELLTFTANQINKYVNTLGVSAEQMLYLSSLPESHDLLSVHHYPFSDNNVYSLIKSHLDGVIEKRAKRREDRRIKRNQTRRTKPIFQIGDIVFASEKHLIKGSTGLRNTYSGPYIVFANDKDFGYVLKHLSTGNLIKRSNEFLVPAKQPAVKGLLSHNWDEFLPTNKQDLN